MAAVSGIEGELQRRLAGVAGVQAVTAAPFTPLEGDEMSVLCSGLPVTRPIGQCDRCVLDGVSDGYFRTLRIPIVRGREPRRGEAGVAVINETLARRLFPGSDPVGRTLRLPIRTPPGPITWTFSSWACRRTVGISGSSRRSRPG